MNIRQKSLGIHLSFFAMFLNVLSLAGCGPGGAGSATGAQSADVSARANPLKPSDEMHRTEETPCADSTTPGCFDQHYTQSGSGLKKLDLIFVVDTSASLERERAKIADNIDAFMKKLPLTLDFQIGLVLGHGLPNVWSGVFLPMTPIYRFLESEKLSRKDIRKWLTRALESPPTDVFSDGGEELLFSFTRMVDLTLKYDYKQRIFFRKDAALSVVFITDENDICYPGTVPDQDHVGSRTLEQIAYERDCSGITAEALNFKLGKLMGQRPFLLNGIVYTDPKTMPHGGSSDPENEIGLGIIDAVHRSGGKLIDLASERFSEGMSAIGEATTSHLEKQTRFTIHYENYDPATVSIKVEGKPVPFTLNGSIVQIDPKDAGRRGADIEVHYCLKVVPPSGEPSTLPSIEPSSTPSSSPTVEPSSTPSASPTVEPSSTPSTSPTVEPSSTPSSTPTVDPTPTPTDEPSSEPSSTPTVEPSSTPSSTPTVDPTPTPTDEPSSEPSSTPTVEPSSTPSSTPTVDPTPTGSPSSTPSASPTVEPSSTPTGDPSSAPTDEPSSEPSSTPTVDPTPTPTDEPSSEPSSTPTVEPSATPSSTPTVEPSSVPSSTPTVEPSITPSPTPTVEPSTTPSSTPTSTPTVTPSPTPSASPSATPSASPSPTPTTEPCMDISCDGGWIGV